MTTSYNPSNTRLRPATPLSETHGYPLANPFPISSFAIRTTGESGRIHCKFRRTPYRLRYHTRPREHAC